MKGAELLLPPPPDVDHRPVNAIMTKSITSAQRSAGDGISGFEPGMRKDSYKNTFRKLMLAKFQFV